MPEPLPVMSPSRPSSQDIAERVAREDVVTFVNAAFVCTGQREFYGDTHRQAVSIRFLHAYLLGNYRRLYARSLAAGINDWNKAIVITNLLAAGAPADARERAEEGELLFGALRSLPPPRALRLLASLRAEGVNNRRARAVARRYLASRPDPSFDAVKYRAKVRTIVRHAHAALPAETATFLLAPMSTRKFETPLYERFRAAHFAKDAIYELPFTIAEGLAAKHGVRRDEFLRRIEPRLTAEERRRLQKSSAAAGVTVDYDLAGASLTKLALYVLSLPLAEREAKRDELTRALERAAERAASGLDFGARRVAAILDRSHSASGTTEKRRRPLAVALGVHHVLARAAATYRAFWTLPANDALLVTARGQTSLAAPLMDAFEWGADEIVIVSDGFENDPPIGAAELLRVFSARLDPERRVSIVHVNPVFDAESLAPKALSTVIPTVGLRDAEDLATVLGFARFGGGAARLSELESYLTARAVGVIRAALAERPSRNGFDR